MGANGCHVAPSVLGGIGERPNVAAGWRKTNVGVQLGYIAETSSGQYVAANQVTLKNDGNGLVPDLGN